MKFIQTLDKTGVKYEIVRTISSPVYNGFRIMIEDEDAVADLKLRDDVSPPSCLC
jgi:hypothetical protein